MMWAALAAAALDQSGFSASMERYMACLSAGIPSDLASQNLQTRSHVYRQAAAQCQRERRAAIDAAVSGREPGISEAEARSQAIDIIDTLDPMSNVPKR